MPRTFIAVSVDPKVRAALAKLPRQGAPSLRWVAENQYHITLKFLGDIPETKVEPVREAVEEAAVRGVLSGTEGEISSQSAHPHHPNRIRLVARGIGAFPTPRRARVIWAGVEGETDVLRRLQARIEENLAARGFTQESRPFTPHITVARCRVPGPLPVSLQRYAQHDFGEWAVDRVLIMESRLSPAGPSYIILHEVPLG